ncbi:MAG: NTP transferase domain-containing protein, partial [Pseudomonadota bacterium]
MSDAVHAVVLAAGGASRFGALKQRACLDGRTLLARAVAQAQVACPAGVT